MADVRALLRQQRTARRVEHPHAVYSDSGKLSCAVCSEPVRSDTAWDDHLRSALHRQSMRALQAQGLKEAETGANLSANGNGATTQKQKRRHSETEADDDVEMGSGGEDEPSRKKHHRFGAAAGGRPTIEIQSPGHQQPSKDSEARKKSLSTPQLTPPLGRRSSGTPAQGVEMRIPSRPATPIAIKDSFLGGSFGGGNGSGNGSGSGSGSNSGSGGLPSAATTPKMAPLGRSPLIPQEASTAAAVLPDAAASASGPLNDALNGAGAATAAVAAAATPTLESKKPIDEDEWAAFEAEVVNAPPPRPAGTKPDMNGGVVVSANPVSAQDIAAADDDRATRRAAEEAKLEDEKEEATRALEDEFEDMQELESRVQKLKEKREALRNQTQRQQLPSLSRPAPSLAPPAVLDAATARRPSAAMIDKENIRQQLAASQNGAAGKGHLAGDGGQGDTSDEDEDADEADWDAFRFKA